MKFQMRELIGTETITARLGAGDQLADRFNDKDAGKLVKLVGDSRYNTCATGDLIEGRVVSVDTATSDGYSTGAVQHRDRFEVTLDGAQADGTGSVAVLEFVVAGPQSALNAVTTLPKVRKATDQATAKASPFAWRVVSILTGSGAAGSTATIERVG